MATAAIPDDLPRADTERRLVKILLEHLGVSEADVRPDVLLVPAHDDRGRKVPSDRQDLGCDSLDVVEIVMACEDEFNIDISDDETQPLNDYTFGQLVDFIHGRVEARNA